MGHGKMRVTRLEHAMATGALSLPQTGRILLIRPRAEDEPGRLAALLPMARVEVVTGFAPDADAYAAAGFAVSQVPAPGAAAAIVCLPRARALAEALLASADASVQPGGIIVVDGQKTDGVEPMQRALSRRGIALSDAVVKAHGRLFTFAAGSGALADWAAAPRTLNTGPAAGFVTRPGVFSADGADPASVLLAEALPDSIGARVIDLGAGWGFLAAQALARPGVQEVILLEAEPDALACARDTLGHDPRARFVWGDARHWRPEVPADTVLCNPPFHAGREADPGLGAAFIRAAAGMLKPGGALWLVANRHLPYDAPLAASFREVAEVAATPAYRIWRAARPLPRVR